MKYMRIWDINLIKDAPTSGEVLNFGRKINYTQRGDPKDKSRQDK